LNSNIFASSVVGEGMPGLTLALLESNLRRYGRPLDSYKVGDTVHGVDATYKLSAKPGVLEKDTGFEPELTPAEMLMLGVFEGKYLNDSVREFPAEWFVGALHYGRLSPEGADPERCNLFGIKSRQPLSVWRENAWAPSQVRKGRTDDHYHGLLGDPLRNPDYRGWFQWYCRYWMGRRIPELDTLQIKRWRSFRRHAGGIRARCRRGDLTCSPRERQALLQWAYNPFI